MKCIITGCALVGPDGRWVAGDLFQTEHGDYVFNGNVDHLGYAQWIDDEPHYTRRLAPVDWWERRGVFVIDGQPNLNTSALEYIRL